MKLPEKKGQGWGGWGEWRGWGGGLLKPIDIHSSVKQRFCFSSYKSVTLCYKTLIKF